MNLTDQKKCPHCGSTNTLPFEDEETYQFNYPLWIGIVSGILLFAGYFLFMIISYLTFPLIVFAGILLSSKFVNIKFKKKTSRPKKKYHLCLDCSENFKI